MPAAVQHVLTITLEDDDQVDELTKAVDPSKWANFETPLTAKLDRTLELLDRARARATFFALGWTADHFPDVLRKISGRGHELASRGYYPRPIGERTAEELRADLKAARSAIERATGLRVSGYRVARDWLVPNEHWIFDVLAEEGYAYDSSLLPTGFRYRSDGGRRYAHSYQTGSRSIWEFPLSSARVLGFDRPFTAGPRGRPELSRRAFRGIQQWIETCESPLVLGLHVWD